MLTLVEAAARTTGPLGRAVQEALTCFLSPEDSEQLLRAALGRAGLRCFPEDPTQARAFVEGPLWETVADAFGPEAARFVRDDLAPICALSSSGVRRKDGFWIRSDAGAHEALETRDRIFSAPPPDDGTPGALPENLPHLLVLSATDPLPPELTRGLESAARVASVVGAFELFAALEMRTGPVWLLVDGHRPAVEPSTLASFLRPLASRCRVVLWGWDGETSARLVRSCGWESLQAGDDWTALTEELVARMSLASEGRRRGLS